MGCMYAINARSCSTNINISKMCPADQSNSLFIDVLLLFLNRSSLFIFSKIKSMSKLQIINQ
jgi:hypothetical protein